MRTFIMFCALFTLCGITYGEDETDDKHADEAVGTGLLILALLGLAACCWKYFKKMPSVTDTDEYSDV